MYIIKELVYIRDSINQMDKSIHKVNVSQKLLSKVGTSSPADYINQMNLNHMNPSTVNNYMSAINW